MLSPYGEFILHLANANLAALIGSRICHDLISPVGAVGNGLELMQMAGGKLLPEMALIEESVEAARLRILFFRIAYGMATPGQMVGHSEVRALLAGLAKGGRVTFDWQFEGDCPRSEVRLAFLALQCLETAMPYGGTITAQHQSGIWTIKGVGERLRVEPALWGNLSLERPDTKIAPSEVQFALLPVLLADEARRLKAEMGTAEIVLRF
ncbi:MAG TPA: histidine phosphotransferase [Rhodobacteraceae bacterium]|jgi:histidine phosphotransferase ChpT|nr:histidine phosphotransferase [Paracoccaceae bacterium]HBV54620.1 histidine phosphotransferase [Paracoccaceae bacterium]